MQLTPQEQAEMTKLGSELKQDVPPPQEVAPGTGPLAPPQATEVAPGTGPLSPEALAGKPPAEPQKDGSIVGGIAAGLVRAPAQALGGAIDTAADLGAIAGEGAAAGILALDDKFFNNNLAPRLNAALQSSSKFQTITKLGDLLYSAGDENGDGYTDFASKLSSGKGGTFATLGNDTANQLSSDVGSVVLAFGGIRSLATRAGLTRPLAKGGANLVKDSLVAGVAGQVLDPDQERLSNALINMGVNDPTGFLEALAQEEDEDRAKARIALFVEEAGTSAIADGIFKVGAYAFNAIKGNTKRLAQLEAETLSELPTPPSSGGSASPSADVPPASLTQGESSLTPSGVEVPEGQAIPTPIDDTALRTQMDAFAKRAGVDNAGSLEVDGGKFVVPDGQAKKLNEAVRAEGSPQDIFVDQSKRALTVEGGGSIPRSVLKALKEGKEPPTNSGGIKLNSSEGIEAVAREFRAALPPKSAADLPPVPRRGDKLLIEESDRIADELGTDINTGKEYLNTLAGDVADLDAKVAFAKRFNEYIYKGVDDIDPQSLGSLSEDALQEVRQNIHNAYLIGEMHVKIGSGLGRALRARRTMTADDYLVGLRNPQRQLELDRANVAQGSDLPALPGSPAEMKKWLMDFQSTKGNPSRRTAFLTDSATLPSPGNYVMGSVANFFTVNILSGLNTFTTNLFAPAIVAPLRTSSKFLGGVSRAGLLALKGDTKLAKQEAELAMYSAQAHAMAGTQMMALFGNMAKQLLSRNVADDVGGTFAARNASGVIEATRRGQSVLGQENFLDTVNKNWISLKNTEQQLSFADKTGYMLGNTINLWPNLFQRFAASVDEIAQRISYTGEMANHLMVEAQTRGLSGKPAREFVREKLPGALSDTNAATSPKVLREANRTTLMMRPGSPGGLSEQGHQWVNRLRKDIPLTRLIAPIYNVPMNGVGETLRFIPGSNFFLKELKGDISGARGRVIQNEAYGRWASATALAGVGYLMAKDGLLTGEGPSDPRAKRRWLEAGYRPNSIRFGKDGGWIDYSRADQPASILGIMAAFNDSTVQNNDADANQNVLLKSAGALASIFRDRSSLQGIVDIMSIDDSGMDKDTLERRINSILSSIAVPTFVNNTFTNPQDTLIRRRGTLSQQIQARLPPGLKAFGIDYTSDQLAPLLNSMGEPVYKRRDTIHENIFPYLHDDPSGEDIVMDHLMEMAHETGYNPGIIFDGDLLPKGVRASDIVLDDIDHERLEGNEFGNIQPWDIVSEYAYRRGHMKLSGALINDKINDEVLPADKEYTLREGLTAIIQSEKYNDPDKYIFQKGTRTLSQFEDPLTGKSIRNKNYLMQKIFSTYGQKAREDLASRSKKFATMQAVVDLKKSTGTALREISTLDIIKDPSILNGMKIRGVDLGEKLNRDIEEMTRPSPTTNPEGP